MAVTDQVLSPTFFAVTCSSHDANLVVTEMRESAVLANFTSQISAELHAVVTRIIT